MLGTRITIRRAIFMMKKDHHHQLHSSVVSRNWLVFRCAQNGLERGATREHIRSDLTPRTNEAPGHFRRDPPGRRSFRLARRCSPVTDRWRVCSSLAPSGRRKSLAAKHQPIARHHTRRRRSTDRTSRATAFPGQPFNALSISRFCVQERRKGPQGIAISGDGVIEASANGEGAVLYCPENGTPRASTSFLR
jgi:hypothetical protein